MKPIHSLALLGAISVAAQAAVTDPVGYISIPLPGTAGDGPLEIVSQGLLPADAVKVASTATDVTSTYVEDTGAAWTPSAFVGFFVEITNGPLAGTFTQITANTATQLTTFDDISAAGTTPTFRVVESFTVEGLLGNPPAASVLGGGTSAGAADNMLILDADSAVYDTIWYKNGGIGGTGWRASSTGTADAAGNVIHPSAGLLFQRKQAADGELVITGTVKTTPTDIFVVGDGASTKLNIVSIHFPVDQLTLGASGLYTGDDLTGLKGGTSAGAADNVLIYDSSTGIYDTIWYKNGGIGGTGWRASSTGTADASGNIIPAGSGVLIQRKAGPSFTWEVPAVTVAP